MRLAKSVKVILGIVASSSAALVLSGSAFASDAGAGTTSEKLITDTSQQLQGAVSKVVKTETTETGSSASSDQKDSTSDDKTPLASSTVGTPVSGESKQAVSQTSSKAVDQSAVSQSAAPVVTKLAKDVVSVSNAKSDAAVSATVHGDGVKTVAQDNDVTRAVAAAQVSDTSPAGQSTKVVDPVPAVAFRSSMLPVQSKITNSRALAADDLAGFVPSAPAQQQNPAKVPTPSQPTGFLTRLTSELAGIVVPHVFSGLALGAVHAFAEATLILASFALLLGLTSVTFGAWLRRGGYAHAARSDVSGTGVSSLFATPARMSYVPAIQPTHSSFLMVSETKTVLSMVATLSERRK